MVPVSATLLPVQLPPNDALGMAEEDGTGDPCGKPGWGQPWLLRSLRSEAPDWGRYKRNTDFYKCRCSNLHIVHENTEAQAHN